MVSLPFGLGVAANVLGAVRERASQRSVKAEQAQKAHGRDGLELSRKRVRCD
jgi:hypothetical protein